MNIKQIVSCAAAAFFRICAIGFVVFAVLSFVSTMMVLPSVPASVQLFSMVGKGIILYLATALLLWALSKPLAKLVAFDF
jgi:hypothetical protein